MINKLKIKEKLLSRIVVTNDCWEWQGAMGGSNDQYGVLRVNNQQWYAHRLSYALFKRKSPKGLHVCHSCDNPKCVNPDHLFLGTQKDNIQDCIKKGRRTRVPSVNRAISIKKANRIKQFIKEHYPMKKVTEIANKFKVTYIVVYNILKGNHYKN
jgi:hypothetical protein